jgi:hypothetical protein
MKRDEMEILDLSDLKDEETESPTPEYEEPAAEVAVGEDQADPAETAPKPARKQRKAPRKKAAATKEDQPVEKQPFSLDDLAVADLRTSGLAYSDQDVVVVVNTNPYPVTANNRGQSLAGYERGLVSINDPVSKRAIESGMLLVPSGQ